MAALEVYKDFVRHIYSHAVSRQNFRGGWEILPSAHSLYFDSTLGAGETEIAAWKDAYENMEK